MYRGVRTQYNSQELCVIELYFCCLRVTASMRYDYPEGPRCHGNKTWWVIATLYSHTWVLYFIILKTFFVSWFWVMLYLCFWDVTTTNDKAKINESTIPRWNDVMDIPMNGFTEKLLMISRASKAVAWKINVAFDTRQVAVAIKFVK